MVEETKEVEGGERYKKSGDQKEVSRPLHEAIAPIEEEAQRWQSKKKGQERVSGQCQGPV